MVGCESVAVRIPSESGAASQEQRVRSSESGAKGQPSQSDEVTNRWVGELIMTKSQHELEEEFHQRWFDALAVAGQKPRILDFVEQIQGADRPALLAALLDADVTYRRSIGESPNRQSYLELGDEALPYIQRALESTEILTPQLSTDRKKLDTPVENERERAEAAAGVGRRPQYSIVRAHAQGGLGRVSLARDLGSAAKYRDQRDPAANGG